MAVWRSLSGYDFYIIIIIFFVGSACYTFYSLRSFCPFSVERADCWLTLFVRKVVPWRFCFRCVLRVFVRGIKIVDNSGGLLLHSTVLCFGGWQIDWKPYS